MEVGVIIGRILCSMYRAVFCRGIEGRRERRKRDSLRGFRREMERWEGDVVMYLTIKVSCRIRISIFDFSSLFLLFCFTLL